jgi:hypothetical protein
MVNGLFLLALSVFIILWHKNSLRRIPYFYVYRILLMIVIVTHSGQFISAKGTFRVF